MRTILFICLSLGLFTVLSAQDTITVVSYNILNFPNGNTSQTTGDAARTGYFVAIMEDISPDIILLQEVTAGSGADDLVTALNNSVVLTKTYARAPVWTGYGSPGSQIGNMLLYNTDVITLLSQLEIPITNTSMGLQSPRKSSSYELEIFSSECPQQKVPLYCISSHLKAGQDANSTVQRELGADDIMQYINSSLGTTDNVIVGGDMNLYSAIPAVEPAYEVFLSDNTYSEQLTDLLGPWIRNSSNPTDVAKYTQSTRTSNQGNGGATGGLDDRFDFIFVNDEINSGSQNLSYVAGSNMTYGSSNIYNSAATAGTSPLANEIELMSDHYPVVAKIAVAYPPETACNCDITQINVQNRRCDGNDLVFDVAFTPLAGSGNYDIINITDGNTIIGNGTASPITVTIPNNTDTTALIIQVRDNADPMCQSPTLEVIPYDCTGSPCFFTEVEVQNDTCNGSVYEFDLAFVPSNTGSFFEVLRLPDSTILASGTSSPIALSISDSTFQAFTVFIRDTVTQGCASDPLLVTPLNCTVDYGCGPYLIGDVDCLTLTTGFDGFAGAGFTSAPTAGQLCSDDWNFAGFSNVYTYGGENASGDFARGLAELTGETVGGIYSRENSLWFQPTGSDMTPGNATMRVCNLSGASVPGVDLSYDLTVFNDQDRASLITFSYSTNDINYTSVPEFDLTTPLLGDSSTTTTTFMTTLNDLDIVSGGCIFLRWSSNDAGGSGSRDEFGIDNIQVCQTETACFITGVIAGNGTCSDGSYQVPISFDELPQSQFTYQIINTADQGVLGIGTSSPVTVILPSDSSINITIGVLENGICISDTISIITPFCEPPSSCSLHYINADCTTPVIDFTGFVGNGFISDPQAGELCSENWEVSGFTDMYINGGENNTGDFARGSAPAGGGVFAGGIYSREGSIWIQPTGGDFTPGYVQVKVCNDSYNTLEDIEIAYDLSVYNDQNRTNTFNPSYSLDNLTYTLIPDLAYTSPGPADDILYQIPQSKVLTGVNIAPGACLFLRWSGSDGGGSGSRDEFGLDNISVCSADATCSMSQPDTSGPVIINLPDTIVRSVSVVSCVRQVFWTPPTAEDNCPGVTLAASHQPGDIFALGFHDVVYTATDGSGLIAKDSFLIHVTDSIAPVAFCQNISVNLGADSLVILNASDVDAGSYDVCGSVTLTLSETMISCAGPDTQQVVLQVTDSLGNIGSCIAQILTNRNTVLYVDSSAVAGGDGLSWNTALKDLQPVLQYPQNCTPFDTIHVARGTYYPHASDRSVSFLVKDGLVMLGGYPSGGGVRDHLANPTVLSGDISLTNDSTDNSLHVVNSVMGIPDTSVIDGFILERGQADGTPLVDQQGAALINSGKLILRNSEIRNNAGTGTGGILLNEGELWIDNVIFRNNQTPGPQMMNVEGASLFVLPGNWYLLK